MKLENINLIKEYMPYPKSTGKTRKTYTPQFKFDRALEAVKSDNLSVISRKYNVSVNVISNWKDRLVEQGSHIFETTPDQANKELKAKIARLEQMLGKKEIELNLIKNFSDFYEPRSTE